MFAWPATREGGQTRSALIGTSHSRYDLYNVSDIAVAKHKTMPSGTDLIAWTNALSVKLENGTSFAYGPYSPVPDWVQQVQRHAYYACVSYVDEHIGYILGVLERHGILNETLILMHADHGMGIDGSPAPLFPVSRVIFSPRVHTNPSALAAALWWLILPATWLPHSRVSPRRARRVGEEEQL